MEAVVIVPIYQSSLKPIEKVVLFQAFKLLVKHPIVFIGPSSMDYRFISQAFPNDKYKVETFDDSYFKGIEGYNQLLLSAKFYQRFEQYTYMLIHQLDAFVFKDELSMWCQKGYHYVGAPLITDSGDMIVGNGGFSLRHIQKHRDLLEKTYIHLSFRRWVTYYRKFHNWLGVVLRLPLIIARSLGYKNTNKTFLRKFKENEDRFWYKHALEMDASFKKPPVKEAITFAFERSPSKLLEMNNNQLPFGCHAFEKHEPEFWSRYIPLIETV